MQDGEEVQRVEDVVGVQEVKGVKYWKPITSPHANSFLSKRNLGNTICPGAVGPSQLPPGNLVVSLLNNHTFFLVLFNLTHVGFLGKNSIHLV